MVQAAGKIVMKAFAKHIVRYEDLVESERPSQSGRVELLSRVNRSTADEVQTRTAAAVAFVRNQPEVQQIIADTNVPGSDLADGQIERQRNEIQRLIVETVNQLIPNPEYDYSSRAPVGLKQYVQYAVKIATINIASIPTETMDSLVSTVATPWIMGKSTYSRGYFMREMFPLLPDDLQQALRPALDGQADRATVWLSLIPHGLTLFIGDIHWHPEGYDRRLGDYLLKMLRILEEEDGNGRGMIQSIPQFCGGHGHYSNAVPSHATMRNAPALDDRVTDHWLKLYEAGLKTGNFKRLARADISITGISFPENTRLAELAMIAQQAILYPVQYAYKLLHSKALPHQAFTDPCAYVKSLLFDDRIDFVGTGEKTPGFEGKENVSAAMDKRWRWTVASPKYLALLELNNETGLVDMLHNDWGDHALSAVGRPAPAKQNYEHFDFLVSVYGRLEYRDVQVIFAHLGIGRFVRPNDEMSKKTHRIHTWTWEKNERGETHGRITHTRTKEVEAPEHVHKVYELFELVPNARGDIAWNEMTQALMDMMLDPNSKVGKSIIQLFIDHADRILFGSDSVKPVDMFQYHQCATTGNPLFAEFARMDIEAAGGDKERLNEDTSIAFRVLRGNYDKLMDLAYDRGYKWKVDHGVDPTNMDLRKAHLQPERDRLHAGAWEDFKDWAEAIQEIGWRLDDPKFASIPEGIYPRVFRALPESTRLEEYGSPTGVGTSGGYNNDSLWRRAAIEGSTVGLVAATGAALYGLTKAWGLPGEGGAVADRVNDAAFLARAVLGLVRILYTDNLRLRWEEMFEKANVTREGLDQYVSRLFNGSFGLDVTADQRFAIATATEQFWTNYQELANAPLDFAKGYTQDKKVLDLQGKIAAYQSAMSRILNLQDSTVDATDARRIEGQILRFFLSWTHGINVAVGLQELLQGRPDRFKGWINKPEAAFHVLFLVGNLMLGVRAERALVGGRFKVTDTDGGDFPHAQELLGTGTLALGGLAWSVQDMIAAATKIAGHHVFAATLDIITAILKLAFAYNMGKNFASEFNRMFARPMWGPRDQALPLIMVAGTLGIIEIISLVSGDYGSRLSGTAA
jgi:hypothetical protein